MTGEAVGSGGRGEGFSQPEKRWPTFSSVSISREKAEEYCGHHCSPGHPLHWAR